MVDDNRLIRRIFRDALEEEGFECLEAGDARTALKAILEDSPDVCFLDYHLPDGDGLSLLERLRADGPGHPVRIYLLTGSDKEGLSTEAVSRGASGVLIKPVDPGLVIRKVREG